MEAVRAVLKFAAFVAVTFFLSYGGVAYFYLRSDELAVHSTSASSSRTAWTTAFSAFSVAGYVALLFFTAMSLIALLISWLARCYDQPAGR